MKRSRGITALLLLVGLLCAWPAMAQEQSGSIQGVVKDSSGGVLPGVTVEARSPNVVGVSTAITDEKGIYRFPALPPGRYTVTADLSGFSPAKVDNAVVTLGQLLTIDLTLGVASLQENVQVTAEAPLIDTKQNAAFATIQQDVIQRVPKGRDFTSVITMAPGAQAESKAGGEAQIDGASGSENRFIIDGMDTTNLQNGTSGKTMLVDFIQEVQVKSSGYNAEFGGATGGVVSAITKSGSNQVRGSLGIYEENNSLKGPVRAENGYNLWTDTPETSLVAYRRPWQYWSPIAEIGGPLMKDKIWYYGGFAFTSNVYEHDAIFVNDPNLVSRTFRQTRQAYYPNYNVTTQLTPNVRLRLSGSNQRDHQRGGLPTMYLGNRIYKGTNASLYGKNLNGYSSSTFDKNADGSINQEAYDRRWKLTGEDSSNDVGSANLDWVITPTFFINATGGYYRTNYWTPAEARGNATVHILGNAVSNTYISARKNPVTGLPYPTLPTNFQEASGFQDNISSSGYLRNIYDRTFTNINAIWYKSGAGQHVIKTGVRYERFGNDIYNGNVKPRITYYYGNPYRSTGGQTATGKYGYYRVNQTGTIGKVKSNNYSVWLQDSWSVNNKLTINAGVRAENELVPSYKDAPDAIDLKFGFQDKIAPRVGFAYDLKGDGKWKTYGSFGYFYDITKLSLPRGAFGGDHWINYYWTLDTYDWKSIDCGEGSTGCPGSFIEEVDMRHSSNQSDPLLSEYFNRPNMTGIDPNIKPVQTGEFVLGMDHELNSTMSIGLRYVHKWMFRTIEDVGILLPGVAEVYLISNPGFGYTEVMNPNFPQFTTPKAQRDYDAIELRLRKRFSSNWSSEIYYTYSRLYGNYGGLASSDEDGRLDTNINRYFDAVYMSYDANNKAVFGRLATDRPHVVKFNATYDLPWGTSVGASGVVQSGLPMTEEFLFNNYPVYAFGRGSLGRLPIYKNLDLQVQHEFRLGGNRRVSLMANVSNVFDLKSTTGWYSVNRYGHGTAQTVTFDPDDVFFTAPWNPAQLVAMNRAEGAIVDDQAFFKVPNAFQGPRAVRFQAKFSF